jgi:ABC-type antimicrobial peptide transport system permease subunit
MDPITYTPLITGNAHFELRTRQNASALIPEVRKIVREVDSNLPIFGLRTEQEQIDDLLMIERVLARLSVLFGLLALILTCVGLYGLLAYDVTQRTREIGIRIAMGARPRTVQGAMLRGTLALVATGIAMGILCALLGSRALTTILYGVKPDDPGTIVGVGILLLVVSAAAAYFPSRRASRIDPMAALRSD